jgi:glycosyltransferase involved in cell wall biosynthesis
MKIVFWQNNLSPHMLDLYEALATLGNEIHIYYISNISQARKAQGWRNVSSDKVLLSKIDDSRYDIDPSAIHIFQGIRGNGLISKVQNDFKKHNMKFYLMMEKLDLRSFKRIKIFLYQYYNAKFKNNIIGIFCIGKGSKSQYINIFKKIELYDFGYFVNIPSKKPVNRKIKIRKFLFVGRLVKLKNIHSIIDAILFLGAPYTLDIYGDGPEFDSLNAQIKVKKGEHIVKFMGKKTRKEMLNIYRQYDCLVLPSLYDGWGAVTNEALLNGIPAMVSNEAGSASIINNRNGFVFDPTCNQSILEAFVSCIKKTYNSKDIIDDAQVISPKHAANYLIECVG